MGGGIIEKTVVENNSSDQFIGTSRFSDYSSAAHIVKLVQSRED